MQASRVRRQDTSAGGTPHQGGRDTPRDGVCHGESSAAMQEAPRQSHGARGARGGYSGVVSVIKAYQITLKDTRYDVTKTIKDNNQGDYPTEVDHAVVWSWTEGNFSCDCNRSILMHDDESREIMECSDGIIELVDIRNEDGSEVEEWIEYQRVEKDWAERHGNKERTGE